MIRTVGVSRQVQRRAAPILFGQRTNSISTTPKNWMERLFSVPKGWEKFYRKPGNTGKAGESTGKTGSGGPKNEKKPSGGGGGGAGGGGKKDDNNNATRIAGSVVVATAIATLLLAEGNSGR